MNTTTLAPITEAIGWTLIHFTWQATAIAFAFLALSAITRPWRYAAAAVAMLAMLTCAVATLSIELDRRSENPVTTTAPPPATIRGTDGQVATAADGHPPASHPAKTLPATSPSTSGEPQSPGAADAGPWLTLLVAAWLVGIGVGSLRLLISWLRARHLCRSSAPIRDHLIRVKFTELLVRMKISAPVQLLGSTRASVPMVVGAIRPAVILPMRLLTGFDPAQLEAIVAHELAHIRRHDYLVNLLQNVAEALFFFHPAVWWISAVMRQEREHSCDAIAAELSGGALVYGRALAALEDELRGTPQPVAVAASGGSLLQRIQRLTGDPKPRRNPWPAILVGAACLALVATSFLVHAEAQDGSAESGERSDETPGRLSVATLPAALKKGLAWGPQDVDGLSAAIALRPDGDQHRVGATIKREYLVANFGARPVSFAIGHWFQDDHVQSRAVDASGTKVPTQKVTDTGVTLLVDVTLKPDEHVRVPSPPVFLNPIPKGERVSPSGLYLDVAAGTEVGLTAKVDLEKRPKLATGVARLKVVAAGEDAKEAGPVQAERAIKVRGTIVDDATGEPVSDFIIQAGRLDKEKPGEITWGYSETRGGGRGGRFSTNIRWHQGWTARIIADGYLPEPILTKAPEGAGEEPVEMTIRLKGGRLIRGQVLDHTGKPIAGAGVFRIGPTGLRLGGGNAWQSFGEDLIDKNAKPARTDAQGKFELSAGGVDRIAVSDTSFDAWPVTLPEDPKERVLVRLPEPASVIVTYDIDGGVDEEVIFFQSLRHRDPLWRGLEITGKVPIKRGAKQVITALPPGPYQFARTRPIRIKNMGIGLFRDRSFVQLKPGETRTIDYQRENGTRLTGKVITPEGAALSGTIVTVRATEKTVDPVDGKDWLIDYAGVAAAEDGSFSTERVPPGRYRVIAEGYVEPKPDGRIGGRMGPGYTAEVEIEVLGSGEPTEVPPLQLKKVP